VREEFAELVGGIDENIELRRRLPLRKHVGWEVAPTSTSESNALATSTRECGRTAWHRPNPAQAESRME
jgi:hypothetical protein